MSSAASAEQPLGQVAKGTGQEGGEGQGTRPAVPAVALKEFISPFAGEHDGDMLAGLACHKPGRESGWIGERLIELPGQFGPFLRHISIYGDLRVGCGEAFGHPAGVA